MKNKFISIILILVMVSICGCSTATYPMTDEESDAIAQYCAYLLLKYDKNETVSEKLMDWKDLEKLKDKESGNKEEAPSALTPVDDKTEVTSTPVPTQKPEKEKNKDKKKDTAGKDKAENSASGEDKDSITGTPDKKEGSLIPEASGKYVSSLDEVFSGSESQKFVIKYDSYGICKQYDENDYFSISAPKNKNILFVNFKIKNNSDNSIDFDATDYKIDYCLYDGKGNPFSPEVTALHNDLLYLDEKLEKKSDYSSVLLFYVDEKSSDFLLRSTDSLNGKVYDIKLN